MAFIKFTQTDGKDIYLNSEYIESFWQNGAFVSVRFNGLIINMKETSIDGLMNFINQVEENQKMLVLKNKKSFVDILRGIFKKGNSRGAA
jgi:uncharacterized protein YlzI (FlbEa/FlbD family)